MKPSRWRNCLAGAVLVVAALGATAPAGAVLSYNFDFGVNEYTGADPGPANLSLVGGDWVQVVGDVTTNGLSLDFGRGVGANSATSVDWTTAVRDDISLFSGALGQTNLYTDGVGGSQNQQAMTGLRVFGLAPGTYDIFATVYIETSTNLSTASGLVWLGTGSSNAVQSSELVAAVNRPWTGFAETAAEFVSTVGQWNYISNRVTVVEGQAVVLLADLPFGSGDQKLYEPFVSTLQIVLIPEPSSGLLVALGLFLVVWRRRNI